MKEKTNNHIKPKTIIESINNLQEFLECDLMYASKNEWQTEKKMLKYIRGHFNICKKEIKELQKRRR
jgi:hypothetical protein